MDSDPFRPLFADPITDWYRWFAWHPVDTEDRGWRWLCLVWRRRVQLKTHLSGGRERWFQHVVQRSTR